MFQYFLTIWHILMFIDSQFYPFNVFFCSLEFVFSIFETKISWYIFTFWHIFDVLNVLPLYSQVINIWSHFFILFKWTDLILVWTYILRNVLGGFIIMAVSENAFTKTKVTMTWLSNIFWDALLHANCHWILVCGTWLQHNQFNVYPILVLS